MFKEVGWWFPDGEVHLQGMCREHMGDADRGNYQRKKYLKALEYTPDRNRALDIGAHIGLWSYDMVEDFETVEAFEPVAEHRYCFDRNITGANLYPFACGSKPGRVSLDSPRKGHSGHTMVVPGDDVEVVVLDDYDFKDVSFVKVDCEGYELFVLRGLEKTILREKPTIIVEQKHDHASRYGIGNTEAVDYLQDLGMKHRDTLSGDFILSW